MEQKELPYCFASRRRNSSGFKSSAQSRRGDIRFGGYRRGFLRRIWSRWLDATFHRWGRARHIL